MVKVNKRLYKLSKAKTLESYLAHLEFAYELLRLQVRKGMEHTDEINEQIRAKEFINI